MRSATRRGRPAGGPPSVTSTAWSSTDRVWTGHEGSRPVDTPAARVSRAATSGSGSAAGDSCSVVIAVIRTNSRQEGRLCCRQPIALFRRAAQ